MLIAWGSGVGRVACCCGQLVTGRRIGRRVVDGLVLLGGGWLLACLSILSYLTMTGRELAVKG